MSAHVLDVRCLGAGYAGVEVVRDLDLTVSAGEVVALLGANGAGKTTVLRTMAGLLPVIRGQVLYNGESVTARAPHRIARSGLNLVPEDRALFRHLTVRENLRLGRGVKAADVIARFPALAPLMNRKVAMLSGGEQQMLAVGRALAGNVKLLMIDEMSLGLAPIIVETLLPALRSAADERGVGILLVEQHVHLALEVADRAYVLSHGSLATSGEAAALAGDSDLLASSYLGDVAVAG